MAKSENELTWKDLEIGYIVTDINRKEGKGSAQNYESGTWRSQRPTYDFSKCIKCGLCAIFCPEGCISQNKDGNFEADLFYCKGCGICARECWPKVITMVEEVE
jgi:pyruvate ferredoxin oxidoreductase delta subunit